MNWDAVGAGAELLGALATVATLLYLAIQIRQSTRAAQSESNRAIHARRISDYDEIIADPDVARMFREGLSGEQLNADDRLRFEFLMTKFVSGVSLQHMERARGLQEGEIEQRAFAKFIPLLATPGGRAHWARNRDGYPSDFVRKVDAALEEAPTRSAPPAAQQGAAADSA